MKGCAYMAEGQNMNNENVRTKDFSIGALLIRFVVAAVVLAITAFLTPGFTIAGIWPLIMAAIVLSVLDYLVSFLFGIDATPFGRGIVGFIAAVVIIYATQFFVAGYSVSVFGAIIGALIFGIADYLIPGKAL